MRSFTVAVVGGDERAVYAARRLANSGAKIALYGLEEHFMGNCAEFEKDACHAPYLISEAIEDADILLLPVPLSRDNHTVFTPFSKQGLPLCDLECALKRQKKGLIIVGGGFSGFDFSHHTVYDLLQNEDFLLKNALPSAESALGLAILQYRSVLFGTPVALFGFGRIASLLGKMLFDLGADVTVFARREASRKKALDIGLKAEKLSDFDERSDRFSLFFNTIPKPFITPVAALKMPLESLYIELASPPYGMTDAAKKCYRGDHLPAPGLPGRYAPFYAGNTIAESLLTFLSEKEHRFSDDLPTNVKRKG